VCIISCLLRLHRENPSSKKILSVEIFACVIQNIRRVGGGGGGGLFLFEKCKKKPIWPNGISKKKLYNTADLVSVHVTMILRVVCVSYYKWLPCISCRSSYLLMLNPQTAWACTLS
jgi:hypothetical protein